MSTSGKRPSAFIAHLSAAIIRTIQITRKRSRPHWPADRYAWALMVTRPLSRCQCGKDCWSRADGWTGYTHQSRHPNFDAALLRYCMASADTPKQAQKLHDMGARTFRVKTESAPMLPGEIECLSDAKGIKCIDCGLCNGRDNTAPNIVINVHGSRSINFERALGGAQLIARG